MSDSQIFGNVIVVIVVVIVVIFVLTILFRSIRIIPQAYAGVVERLGKYHKTLMPGLNILVPQFINVGDRVKVNTGSGAYVERM